MADINLFDDFLTTQSTATTDRCPRPETCNNVLPRKAELTVYSILGGCAEGEPLCNVPIELYRLGGCKSPGLELVGCKFTDAEGRCVFRCLEPGEYAVKECVNPCILEPEYYPGYRVVFCLPSPGFPGNLTETITILNSLVNGEHCFLNFDPGCPNCPGPHHCGCGNFGFNNWNNGCNCGCNSWNNGCNCGFNNCGCGNCGFNNCGCENNGFNNCCVENNCGINNGCGCGNGCF